MGEERGEKGKSGFWAMIPRENFGVSQNNGKRGKKGKNGEESGVFFPLFVEGPRGFGPRGAPFLKKARGGLGKRGGPKGVVGPAPPVVVERGKGVGGGRRERGEKGEEIKKGGKGGKKNFLKFFFYKKTPKNLFIFFQLFLCFENSTKIYLNFWFWKYKKKTPNLI